MNFEFGILTNSLLFILSAGIIWYFSDKLSSIVEYLTEEFRLGQAFGGTILLSLLVNLPEVVIVCYGALKGDTSLALGNILGGIALQTVLLALFDFASRKEKLPLTTLTSNVNSITQGMFLALILGLVILGAQFKNEYVMFRAAPIELFIVGAWFLSLLFVKKCEQMNYIPDQPKAVSKSMVYTKKGAIVYLLLIALIILTFGAVLAFSSEAIAVHFHISGVVFGATILSLVTALPEISGGIAFVRHKQYQPIISDIFGGNSFLPLLFLLSSLITKRSILTDAHKTDLYLTSLAIILTLIFTLGMVIKSPKRFFFMGLDSWAALIIYAASIIGLIFI